jgi:hypothetical protein
VKRPDSGQSSPEYRKAGAAPRAAKASKAAEAEPPPARSIHTERSGPALDAARKAVVGLGVKGGKEMASF